MIHIARTIVNIGCGCCADRPSLQSDSGKETQAPAAMYTQERERPGYNPSNLSFTLTSNY